MANAIFIQNPQSIYDDVPGEVYHFPKRYLSSVEKTVGDWVILYQGRQGAFGYTAIQKISAVREDISKPGHYFADVEAGSLFDFETLVPRQNQKGIAFEKSLRGPTGAPMSGGHNVSAVRSISIGEFQKIVDYGMCEIPDVSAIPRTGPKEFEPALEQHFSEGQTAFDHSYSETTREKVLTSRLKRDASFSRMVRRAYGNRCAISGLELSNGGGRPEVEAAHIKPVSACGPDIVINGIALSGTIHWMFDRGLITIADDYSIVVSHNKVPSEAADRLIRSDRKLYLPAEERDHPHPVFLKYHREHVFG